MTFRTVKVKNNKTTPQKVAVFEFNSSEGLFVCIEELYKSRYTRNIKSNLYMLNSIYRLVLTTSTSQSTLLKHYYHLADKLMLSASDIAYTKEYFKLITKDDAISRIGKAIVKSL